MWNAICRKFNFLQENAQKRKSRTNWINCCWCTDSNWFNLKQKKFKTENPALYIGENATNVPHRIKQGLLYANKQIQSHGRSAHISCMWRGRFDLIPCWVETDTPAWQSSVRRVSHKIPCFGYPIASEAISNSLGSLTYPKDQTSRNWPMYLQGLCPVFSGGDSFWECGGTTGFLDGNQSMQVTKAKGWMSPLVSMSINNTTHTYTHAHTHMQAHTHIHARARRHAYISLCQIVSRNAADVNFATFTDNEACQKHSSFISETRKKTSTLFSLLLLFHNSQERLKMFELGLFNQPTNLKSIALPPFHVISLRLTHGVLLGSMHIPVFTPCRTSAVPINGSVLFIGSAFATKLGPPTTQKHFLTILGTFLISHRNLQLINE